MKAFIKFTAVFCFLFIVLFSVAAYGEETGISLSEAKIEGSTITIKGRLQGPTDNQQIIFIAAELFTEDEDIFYINQLPFNENSADNESFEIGFDITQILNTESVYIVRVGGTNIYDPAQMIISVGDEAKALLGDVDMDGTISANDAALTLQYVLYNSEEYLQKQIDAMKVTNSEIITSNNAANILAKAVNDMYVFPVDKQ